MTALVRVGKLGALAGLMILGALLALSGTAAGGSRSVSAPVPPPAFSGPELAAQAADNWTGFGGNSFGDRFSTLQAINKSNAGKLRAAWETTLGEPKAENVAGGLEYDGTYYIQSAQGDVFALDASTGALKWKYTGDGAGGGRGLAMGNGLVYARRRRLLPRRDPRDDRQAGLAHKAALQALARVRVPGAGELRSGERRRGARGHGRVGRRRARLPRRRPRDEREASLGAFVRAAP